MEATRLNEQLLEQYVLAGSIKTKPEQLRVLAEHFCDKIRLRVAENPATPPDVLSELAHDRNHEVRIAAGCNPSCHEPVKVMLARDGDIIVRHGLAQNIDTPKMVLEALAEDDNGWVRGEALKTLAILSSKDEVAKQRQLKRSRKHRVIGNFERYEQATEEVAS